MRRSGIQLRAQLHGTGALESSSKCGRGWAHWRRHAPDPGQVEGCGGLGAPSGCARKCKGAGGFGASTQLPVLRQNAAAAHRVMPFFRAMRFSTVKDTRMALAASSAGTWNLQKAEGRGGGSVGGTCGCGAANRHGATVRPQRAGSAPRNWAEHAVGEQRGARRRHSKRLAQLLVRGAFASGLGAVQGSPLASQSALTMLPTPLQ